MNIRILLIDEDENTLKLATSYFKNTKYTIVTCGAEEEMFDFVAEEYFDLYIINTKISNIESSELLAYIKEYDTHTPIILIVNENCSTLFRLLLKYNCTDLIIKPFIPEELEIRIKNIFMKARKKIIQIDENTYYDILTEELYVNNTCVRLRKKERRILTLLLQNVNCNVSLNTIYNYVWEGEIKTSYPLRQLICDIRKLLKSPKNHIHPITGNGYKFEL